MNFNFPGLISFDQRIAQLKSGFFLLYNVAEHAVKCFFTIPQVLNWLWLSILSLSGKKPVLDMISKYFSQGTFVEFHSPGVKKLEVHFPDSSLRF